MFEEFDAIVIGAGHAGIEAGLSLARKGHKTLMLTINLEAVGFLACNPSIGGTAKGQLVCEIDALGGQMGASADKTLIQLRMLNSAKGPAVQSLRAQIDKVQYHIEMKHILEATPNLFLKQGEVTEILTENNTIVGVKIKTGEKFMAKAVVICSGVYMQSRIIIGNYTENIGPSGFKRSEGLSDSLKNIGFTIRRFKTGTPSRIHADTIDFSKAEVQSGDDNIQSFSALTKGKINNVADCYLIYTNNKTHEIIRNNLDKAPMYTGLIEGLGPRYCPSIETKIVRFADKERHQLFLEPESLSTKEYYLQGLSTSMPVEIQSQMIHSIVGLENAFIMRDAYAIEYDCIDSLELLPTLESKKVHNLFFAGQINGTSGYEEAGAQGIVAGINAGLKLEGRPPMILTRSDGYIGVLIDDLVTKGTNEPYRMMTSRAEFRLLLRQDNADMRLTPIGREVGLVSDERYQLYLDKKAMIDKAMADVKKSFSPAKVNPILERCGETAVQSGIMVENLLKRKTVKALALKELGIFEGIDDKILEFIETEIKYAGYIDMQKAQFEQMKKVEDMPLSAELDYEKISGLRLEAQQKLQQIKPLSIAQASRISGVSPADLMVLLIYLKRNNLTK